MRTKLFFQSAALMLCFTLSSLAQNKADVRTETNSGTRTTTFETPRGKVIVHLPDDMATGDTISGTVSTEPAGNSEQEKQRNSGELRGYVVEIENQRSSVSIGTLRRIVLAAGDMTPQLILRDVNGNAIVVTTVMVAKQPSSGATIFQLPTTGQVGRPIQIVGPFDGDSTNTTVRVGGQQAPIIAESPRQIVVSSPTNVVGSTEIQIVENGTSSKRQFRNLKIDLTAPKTSLLKGESTELHVEVQGLEGLRQPVPVQLQNLSPQTIQLSGGDVQTRVIQPQDVKTSDRYSWNVNVAGVQSGSFSIIASVMGGTTVASPNPAGPSPSGGTPTASPSPATSPMPTPTPLQGQPISPGDGGIIIGGDHQTTPATPRTPPGLAPLDSKRDPQPNPQPNPQGNPQRNPQGNPTTTECKCDRVKIEVKPNPNNAVVQNKVTEAATWIYEDVDAYGNRLRDGKPVDETGRPVDVNGHLVNGDGNLVNAAGQLVDQNDRELPRNAKPVHGATEARPVIVNDEGKPKAGPTKKITGVRVITTMEDFPFTMDCSGMNAAACTAAVNWKMKAIAQFKKSTSGAWPQADTAVEIEPTPGLLYRLNSLPKRELVLEGKCVKDASGNYSCHVTGNFDVGQAFVVKFPHALIVELIKHQNELERYVPTILITTTWSVDVAGCPLERVGTGWDGNTNSVTRTQTAAGLNPR